MVVRVSNAVLIFITFQGWLLDQEEDCRSPGWQIKELQGTVARLESRDAEAAKAAEVLKARVTLLEGSMRLLQGEPCQCSGSCRT